VQPGYNPAAVPVHASIYPDLNKPSAPPQFAVPVPPPPYDGQQHPPPPYGHQPQLYPYQRHDGVWVNGHDGQPIVYDAQAVHGLPQAVPVPGMWQPVPVSPDLPPVQQAEALVGQIKGLREKEAQVPPAEVEKLNQLHAQQRAAEFRLLALENQHQQVREKMKELRGQRRVAADSQAGEAQTKKFTIPEAVVWAVAQPCFRWDATVGQVIIQVYDEQSGKQCTVTDLIVLELCQVTQLNDALVDKLNTDTAFLQISSFVQMDSSTDASGDASTVDPDGDLGLMWQNANAANAAIHLTVGPSALGGGIGAPPPGAQFEYNARPGDNKYLRSRQGGVSAAAVVLIVLAVLVFLGLLLWFIFYRKGKRRALKEHRDLLKAAQGNDGSRRGSHVSTTASANSNYYGYKDDNVPTSAENSSPNTPTAGPAPDASAQVPTITITAAAVAVQSTPTPIPTSGTATLSGNRTVSQKQTGKPTGRATIVDVSEFNAIHCETIPAAGGVDRLNYCYQLRDQLMAIVYGTNSNNTTTLPTSKKSLPEGKVEERIKHAPMYYGASSTYGVAQQYYGASTNTAKVTKADVGYYSSTTKTVKASDEVDEGKVREAVAALEEGRDNCSLVGENRNFHMPKCPSHVEKNAGYYGAQSVNANNLDTATKNDAEYPALGPVRNKNIKTVSSDSNVVNIVNKIDASQRLSPPPARAGTVEEKFGEQNFRVLSEMRILGKNRVAILDFGRVSRFF